MAGYEDRSTEGSAPHPPVPVLVRLVPMDGSLIGATDTTHACVYVRDDATEAEIGAAILAGVRDVADEWFPRQRLSGQDTAPVQQLHGVEPRPRQREENRGLV